MLFKNITKVATDEIDAIVYADGIKEKLKVSKSAITTAVLQPRWLDGKKVYLLTRNKEEEAPRYSEFVPQSLPDKYRYMTPSWLGNGLGWSTQAQTFRVEPVGIGEKVKIVLAVVAVVSLAMVIGIIAIVLMG